MKAEKWMRGEKRYSLQLTEVKLIAVAGLYCWESSKLLSPAFNYSGDRFWAECASKVKQVHCKSCADELLHIELMGKCVCG